MHTYLCNNGVGALRIQWFNYQVSRDMFKFALRLGIVDDEHN